MTKNTSLHTLFLTTLYGALVVFVYFYLHKNPCNTPLTYSLGRVDSQFGIETSEVEKDILDASSLWNKALPGTTLLKEVTRGGDITINFVFDERQRATIREQKLKAEIQDQKQNLSELKTTLSSLTEEYTKGASAYDAQKADYATLLASYNKEVAYWNKQGGAPPDVYAELTQKKSDLENTYNALQETFAELDALATKIHTYNTLHNTIVSDVNATIEEANADMGKQFEEGVFDPKDNTITIYEYESKLGLKRVLAHELGHTLGLDHVPNKNSIMYYLNDADSFALSHEDTAALTTMCKLQ